MFARQSPMSQSEFALAPMMPPADTQPTHTHTHPMYGFRDGYDATHGLRRTGITIATGKTSDARPVDACISGARARHQHMFVRGFSLSFGGCFAHESARVSVSVRFVVVRFSFFVFRRIDAMVGGWNRVHGGARVHNKSCNNLHAHSTK